jgi:hypothetical protein
MQQFTVPQFIDVEDKIIGPVTTRQFVIILGACLFTALFYKIFDFSLFIFSTVIVFVITVFFAFVKINSRPFHLFVLNVVQTFKKPNLRVWINNFNFEEGVDAEETIIHKNEPIPIKGATLQSSRLDELSLIVDTQGAYKGEQK